MKTYNILFFILSMYELNLYSQDMRKLSFKKLNTEEFNAYLKNNKGRLVGNYNYLLWRVY
jgi:hypothetical protein